LQWHVRSQLGVAGVAIEAPFAHGAVRPSPPFPPLLGVDALALRTSSYRADPVVILAPNTGLDGVDEQLEIKPGPLAVRVKCAESLSGNDRRRVCEKLPEPKHDDAAFVAGLANAIRLDRLTPDVVVPPILKSLGRPTSWL
jgi:hypothetical protein